MVVIVPGARLVTGPLVDLVEGFCAELLGQGYSPRSLEAQVRLVRHLSGWLEVQGLGVGELTTEVAARFVADRRAVTTNMRSERALRPLLGYLRGLGVAPEATPRVGGPVEVLLGSFAEYLAIERALSPATVRSYVSQVRPFVSAHFDPVAGLALVTRGDVEAFIIERAAVQRARSVQVRANALRSLLGWVWRESMIAEPLAAAVGVFAGPSVTTDRPDPLDDVELAQLQGALAGQEPSAGRRNQAMVAMMLRLGLRAGEVAALLLDDIDWRAGLVTVRGKRGRVDVVPLPVDVGKLLVGYLRDGRPVGVEHREVFLAVDAPHRPVGSAAVTSVVGRALRAAGVDGVGAAHRLRHTAACRALANGAGLVEVGQFLRHQTPLVAAMYTKSNPDMLAVIARPWPTGAQR